MNQRFLPPAPLAAMHDIARFDCGQHEGLAAWLRDRAAASEGLSARTYVLCPSAEPQRIAGYYCIAAAMVQRAAMPSAKLRKGMPDQVPLMLIGRLAIDVAWQGQGLGSALLADALRRCRAVSDLAGVRGITAHAIDEAAAAFYERHGFVRSPLGERVMLMPIETALSFA